MEPSSYYLITHLVTEDRLFGRGTLTKRVPIDECADYSFQGTDFQDARRRAWSRYRDLQHSSLTGVRLELVRVTVENLDPTHESEREPDSLDVALAALNGD